MSWIVDMASVGVYLYIMHGSDQFNVVEEFGLNLELQGYFKELKGGLNKNGKNN